MNKRLISVFTFALVVSAAASLLLYRMVASRISASAKPQTARVLVATHNIGLGSLIRELDIKQAEWTGTIPAEAVMKPEDAIGRGVVENIYEGEPILEKRLAAKGAGGGLAATIPTGMRAVAVRVNEVVGLAGFVVPGMRVDILIMGNPPGGNQSQGTLTKTLLQNLQVLSAGQQIEKNAEGKPVSVQVVNLLVTPDQAEILSLAANDARIQLVLRNPLDTEESKTSGTAMANLFNGQPYRSGPPSPRAPAKPREVAAKAPQPPPMAVAKPAPPVTVLVEVIQGGRREATKFEQPTETR